MLLREDSIVKMLAEADAYAVTNKENYVEIIDRYFVVQNKADGTVLEQAVDRKMNNAIEAHHQAADDAIGKFETKMHGFIRSGKPQEAYNVWKEFPARLRTPETDQQIRQLLEKWLPAEFQPEP